MGLYRNVRSLATCPLFFQKPIPLRMICCRLVWSKSGSTESIYRNLGWERRCLSSKVFNFWVWVFKNALKSANAYLHCCCGCAECMHVSNFASAPFVSIPPPPPGISLVSHDIRLLQKLPGDFDQEYLTVLAPKFLKSCSKHIMIRLCSFTINARLVHVLNSSRSIREVLESISYTQNSFISNLCVSKEAMRLHSLRKCYTSISQKLLPTTHES